jgi:hypothetical protein
MHPEEHASLEFRGKSNDRLPHQVRPKRNRVAEEKVPTFLNPNIDLKRYLEIGKLLTRSLFNKILEYWGLPPLRDFLIDCLIPLTQTSMEKYVFLYIDFFPRFHRVYVGPQIRQ